MLDTPTEDKLARGFEALAGALQGAKRRQGAALNLSALQVNIVTMIARGGADTVTALAERLALTKPTISDAVRVLEKKQLVRKEKSAADSRRQMLSLTPKGRQLGAKMEQVAPPLAEKLAALSEDEKTGMWLNLLLLLHGLETNGLSANQRMCLTCCHLSMGSEGEYFCGALQQTLEPAELRLECEIYG